MQPASLIKERIDWQVVRNRLHANERVLEQALTPTAQRIDDVRRKRAVNLAQVGKETFLLSSGVPVLVFRLGQERYAIELKHVAEVLPFGYHAPVPRSPPQFLGLISVRGELRAVVDLRHFSSAEASASGVVLMLRRGTGNEQVGLKVDSVEELREIRPEEVTEPAAGSFVAGLTDGSIALLSVNAVLERVFSNQESPTK
jgi:chemotaxis signal transduction protein